MAHYYAKTENGVEARHFVAMAKDPSRTRPTRLSDVKKWWRNGELVAPSVTTILNVLDKPALVNWKVDKHLEAAYSYKAHELDLDGYKQEIKRVTADALDAAPRAGTNFHDLMERWWIDQESLTVTEFDLCHKVSSQMVEKTNGEFKWSDDLKVEVNFISEEGYAGQADLVDKYWVIDYKTKESADKFKPGKMAYDDHAMQLAAYRNGLGLHGARCANVFVCLETGEVDFHEHDEESLERGFELFKHCLAIWQIKNNCTEQFN